VTAKWIASFAPCQRCTHRPPGQDRCLLGCSPLLAPGDMYRATERRHLVHLKPTTLHTCSLMSSSSAASSLHRTWVGLLLGTTLHGTEPVRRLELWDLPFNRSSPSTDTTVLRKESRPAPDPRFNSEQCYQKRHTRSYALKPPAEPVCGHECVPTTPSLPTVQRLDSFWWFVGFCSPFMAAYYYLRIYCFLD
jgi:hypothetical protein